MAEAPASRLSDSAVFVVLAGDLSALFLPGSGGLQHTKPQFLLPVRRAQNLAALIICQLTKIC